MDQTRLPKICLNRLIFLANNPNNLCKLKWCQQFRLLLNEHDITCPLRDVTELRQLIDCKDLFMRKCAEKVLTEINT